MKHNIDKLRILAVVEQTGSLAAAARQLNVGASAVSQQISSFEHEIGQQLLNRTTKPATLTSLGVELASHGSRIIDELERAAIVLETADSEIRGRFHIACIATIAVTVLADAIRELHETAPELEIYVHDLELTESVRQLDAQKIDLAIVDDYDAVPAPRPANTVVTELGREPVQIFATSDLPARYSLDPAGVSLETLANESWVLPPSSASCGAAALHLCHAAGFQPDVKLQTNDLLLLRSFVENGHGVTVLPRLALVNPGADTMAWDIADPNAHRSLRALSRQSSHNRPAQQRVLAALQNAARPHLESPGC